ncbi:MAG: methyltransferase domain-containing protein [Smithella sp.]
MNNRLLKKLFKIWRKPYQSETSKVRHLVNSYCIGKGCDIGFGGDKIIKENCDGIDYAKPYAYTGKDKVDIACDLSKEKIPVDDNTYDYVYSSHLIEDFPDIKSLLIEFIRILKSSGNLILVFPDQAVYAAHCIKTGQPLNPQHVHANMGLKLMTDYLKEIESIRAEHLFSSDRKIDYNVVMVYKIYKNNPERKVPEIFKIKNQIIDRVLKYKKD